MSFPFYQHFNWPVLRDREGIYNVPFAVQMSFWCQAWHKSDNSGVKSKKKKKKKQRLPLSWTIKTNYLGYVSSCLLMGSEQPNQEGVTLFQGAISFNHSIMLGLHVSGLGSSQDWESLGQARPTLSSVYDVVWCWSLWKCTPSVAVGPIHHHHCIQLLCPVY